MQKWSYCVLNLFRQGTSVGIFSSGKTVMDDLEYRIYGQEYSKKTYKGEQLDQVIAWLGYTGWELINVSVTQHLSQGGAVFSHSAFFFKKTD